MTTAPCEAFSKHHFHPNTQTSSGEDQNHCAINFLKIQTEQLQPLNRVPPSIPKCPVPLDSSSTISPAAEGHRLLF